MVLTSKFDKYKYKNNTGLVNLVGGFFACYVKYLLKEEGKSILIITPSKYEARTLYNTFGNDDAYLFENDDIYYNDVTISPELKVDRINMLNELMSHDNKIVITDIGGYLEFLPHPSDFLKNKLMLKSGSDFSNVSNELAEMGYERVSMVSKMGEYAVRGFVVDIFPINSDYPVRIELFGDELDSLRYFDIDSQKSIKEIESIEIIPYTLDGNRKVNIYSYLNEPIVIFKDYSQLEFSYNKMLEDVSYYDDTVKKFFDLEEINVKDKMYYFSLDNNITMKLDDVYDFFSNTVPLFNENFERINDYVNEMISHGYTVIISSLKVKQNNFLNMLNFDYILTSMDNIVDDKINLVNDNLSLGFVFSNYVFITDHELFNKKLVKYKKVRFQNSTKIKDLSKLEIGDYVVHDLYGIGIYNGIKVIEKQGVLGDYLEVLYAKGDKLYIPASKIELLGKYTGKDGYTPTINALNSTSWQKVKQRIREKLKYESERLIKVQAARQLKKGFAFSKDSPLQLMFEDEFEYEETIDQKKAIDEIKKDMESEVPMDRLLCGDVGYGKTEVAFRAMFKAVLDNKQVLYLCPTTLLSKQQYEVALERFKNYPVNIEILNRFVSYKKTKQVLKDLKEGKIDILFGTHRILSDDVICNDLGLLVVDEEQRFGVIHKEKIKEIKNNVDVLTLTATPIPRTLQMAILGIKNLSLIETPPKNRKSVVTYVTGYDDRLIRDVIYKEVGRGGQVFILHNRIEDIELVVSKIKKLVPDVSINFAHGRMNKKEFEDVMNDFVNNEFSVLICTTIIETGIDIPNVNTLVVLNADRFGLSQLYQIRGRVGRSDNLAYAYLLYDKKKILTDVAIKRLKVIKEFTALGSGFAIAARDLSIRGAGDILGSEQAGFIDAVGIDLYMKMLNEEINRLKGIDIEEENSLDDSININTPSHIKDSYVFDEDVKITIHKLINSIKNKKQYKDVKKEIEDRFGKVDQDLDIYMNEQLFENFVKKLGIIKVFDNNNYREIIFNKDFSESINYEDLFVKSLEINKNFKFSYKNKMLIIRLDYDKSKIHVVYDFNELLELL